MGNVNTLNIGSISGGCPQSILSASQNLFIDTPFHVSPISDAGMAAEISRLIKSQILCQASTAVYAQTGAFSAAALSFMRNYD